MRTFRALIALLMLLCLVPPLSLLAAALIARGTQCELDLPPMTPLPCAIFGGDFGDVLFTLVQFGWHAIETIPILAALFVGWLIVEAARAASRPATPRPKVVAAARELRQPPAAAASRNRVRGS